VKSVAELGYAALILQFGSFVLSKHPPPSTLPLLQVAIALAVAVPPETAILEMAVAVEYPITARAAVTSPTVYNAFPRIEPALVTLAAVKAPSHVNEELVCDPAVEIPLMPFEINPLAKTSPDVTVPVLFTEVASNPPLDDNEEHVRSPVRAEPAVRSPAVIAATDVTACAVITPNVEIPTSAASEPVVVIEFAVNVPMLFSGPVTADPLTVRPVAVTIPFAVIPPVLVNTDVCKLVDVMDVALRVVVVKEVELRAPAKIASCAVKVPIVLNAPAVILPLANTDVELTDPAVSVPVLVTEFAVRSVAIDREAAVKELAAVKKVVYTPAAVNGPEVVMEAAVRSPVLKAADSTRPPLLMMLLVVVTDKAFSDPAVVSD